MDSIGDILFYRNEIIRMVEGINNKKVLEYFYTFIKIKARGYINAAE